MTRREWAAAVAASAGAAVAAPSRDPILRRNDAAVERYLQTQAVEGRWSGAVPDATGLYLAGSCGGVINVCTASYVHPASRFHGDARVKNAIRLAAEHLAKVQTADGNIDLEVTNFNSPPDTGFVVWNVAEAASVARRHGAPDIEQMLWPFLTRAGAAMAKGGVHTPNHRWVVSSALAQIHALRPDPAYLRRIDQWLAEGIDIDSDGQYTERSTTIYNTVCDRSLVVLGAKLNRPELFEPVRKNLDSMMYLLHPGYEVVTEISRRQDLNQRGTMGRYWQPLAVLGLHDKNGQYWGLAKHFEAEHAALSTLLDNPELGGPGPEPKPVPEDYQRHFPALGLVRTRRGPLSASILLGGSSRFFSIRQGGAVIEAIRFASAFFGKGQFIPSSWSQDGDSWVLRQNLQGAYYQPIQAKVAAGEWGAVRSQRATSEVCKLEQSAVITPTPKGFRLRLQSTGTPGVPVAVEIGVRRECRFSGCTQLTSGAWLLDNAPLRISDGVHEIRVTPGAAEHRYVDVRGAEPKLPCECVYLTGYTPFDRTLELEVS